MRRCRTEVGEILESREWYQNMSRKGLGGEYRDRNGWIEVWLLICLMAAGYPTSAMLFLHAIGQHLLSV